MYFFAYFEFSEYPKRHKRKHRYKESKKKYHDAVPEKKTFYSNSKRAAYDSSLKESKRQRSKCRYYSSRSRSSSISRRTRNHKHRSRSRSRSYHQHHDMPPEKREKRKKYCCKKHRKKSKYRKSTPDSVDYHTKDYVSNTSRRYKHSSESPHTPTNPPTSQRDTYTPPLNNNNDDKHNHSDKISTQNNKSPPAGSDSTSASRKRKYSENRDADWNNAKHYNLSSEFVKGKMSETCLIAELKRNKKYKQSIENKIVEEDLPNVQCSNKIETIVSKRPDPVEKILVAPAIPAEMSMTNNNLSYLKFSTTQVENEVFKQTNGTKVPIPNVAPININNNGTATAPQQDQYKKSGRKSLLSLPMPPTSSVPDIALHPKEKLDSIKMGVSYLNSNEKPFSTIYNASSPSSSDSVENVKRALMNKLESRVKTAEKTLKYPTILNKAAANSSAWNDRGVESFLILNRIGEGTYGEKFNLFSTNHFKRNIIFRNCFQSKR